MPESSSHTAARDIVGQWSSDCDIPRTQWLEKYRVGTCTTMERRQFHLFPNILLFSRCAVQHEREINDITDRTPIISSVNIFLWNINRQEHERKVLCYARQTQLILSNADFWTNEGRRSISFIHLICKWLLILVVLG